MTSKGRVVARARVVVLAFAFSLALSSPALADDGSGRKPPKPIASDRPTSQVAEPRGSGKNGGITTMAINPYGCRGTSDVIHGSGSNPGLVIARAWSKCDLVVAQIETWSRLYKWNCFLIFFCGWDQIGSDYKFVSGPTTGVGPPTAEAIAAANCVVGGGDYRSEGDHKFLGYDGVTYWALTAQPSTHVVC